MRVQKFMHSLSVSTGIYKIRYIPNADPGQIDKKTKWTGGHPDFTGLPEKCIEIQRRIAKAKFGSTPPPPV